MAALPGRAVYFPISIVGYGARRTATLLWEQRILYRLKEYLTFANGRVGIRPLTNSLRGSGARLFVRDVAGQVDAEITSTVGSPSTGRQHHVATLAWPGRLRLAAYYRNEPRRAFHGLGERASEDGRTTFGQRDTYLQVTSRRKLGLQYRADWHLNYHRTRIFGDDDGRYPSTADRYAGSDLPGLGDRVDFAEAGFTLRGLFVDIPGSPTRGNRSRLRVAYRHSIDDDAFSHLQVALLTEQFYELLCRRTVSVQLGTDWRFSPGDNRVPFFDLASLGGAEVLRGYKQGRYRDKGVAYAVGTYKYPVWKLVEGTVFYESGRAFAGPGDLSLADWVWSWGGGLRLWVPQGVVFEFLVARSSELTRTQFAFESRF